MYKEFACYNELQAESVVKKVFTAIKLGADGISVPQVFLPYISDFMPQGVTFSCPIDYPMGLSETKVRNHAILKAIHHKVNAIDLVINTAYLINNKVIEFSSDLASAKAICTSNNVTLRVMLDYREIGEGLFTEMCIALETLGIEYAFPSPGNCAEDYEDNILMCYKLQNDHHLNAIATGSIYLPHHLKMVEDSRIFGVRWNRIEQMKSSIGV
jgi:deoxyribose-phosphate aldolase